LRSASRTRESDEAEGCIHRLRKELSDLRDAALDHLGDLADQSVIEDGPLLRRLIARRCIYGVDLNALSVQLARLSIWIHTFVPGLPLSLLDHNLVQVTLWWVSVPWTKLAIDSSKRASGSLAIQPEAFARYGSEIQRPGLAPFAGKGASEPWRR